MPMKKALYPPDWNAISNRIRFERAQGKCEWCGIPDGATIMRSAIDPAYYMILREEDFVWLTPEGDPIKATELPSEFDNSKEVKVFLATHHVGVDKPDGTPGDRRDKMDCRDENLAALCQRCHRLADMDLDILARRSTRNRKKRLRQEAAGQKELW